MAKNIFEELPARKVAPAQAAPAAAKGRDQKGGREESGEGGSEKRIRQAVYDIRYRARREGIDLRAAYAQYMQNSNLSAPEQAAVRAKLFGKEGGGGDKKESYDVTMTDGATDAVATALYKVFVEKKEEEIQEDAASEKKYKVRVTDKKSGRAYVRYADRQKITELRAKGLDVEMTEHGDPYEGKREGKMDPVAKNPKDRDGDVNNDGKKDSTDKYIYNRRDAINKAIEKKKGMKEEFLVDGTTSTEGQNTKSVGRGPVDNYSNGVVKINPENQADHGKMGRMRRGIYAHTEVSMTASQRRLMEMIAKKNETPVVREEDEKKEKEDKKGCDCCGKDPCECRAKNTYRELLKNKLRAMGMKNPIMLGAPDDEEKVMKIMTSSSAKMTTESSCGGSDRKKKKKKKGY